MAGTKRTYYDVLGLPATATEHDISAAYRSLAVKYHPDTSPDAAHTIEEFKNITEAHENLSDPKKRRRYDEEAGIAQQQLKRTHFVTGSLDLPVTPEEARHGAMVPVKLTARHPCPRCSGEDTRRSVVCRICNGEGFLVRDAFVHVQIPAEAAEGSTFVYDANDRFPRISIRIRVRAAW